MCVLLVLRTHRLGAAVRLKLNQTEHPLPNPPWTSYRKTSVPAPPKPDQLAKFPGYHFGTAASADGKHWHSFTDISKQLQARADTSNNAVYDPDSKEFMIFTLSKPLLPVTTIIS